MQLPGASVLLHTLPLSTEMPTWMKSLIWLCTWCCLPHCTHVPPKLFNDQSYQNNHFQLCRRRKSGLVSNVCICTNLVSWARHTSTKNGRVWWTAYTRVPPHCTLYSAVQSQCRILSRDAIHHCLSYHRSCKDTLTKLLGSVLTLQQVI